VTPDEFYAIHRRRERVRVQEAGWDATSQPVYVSSLLVHALASSEDVPALLEALRLALGYLPR
jgi:hypothetical protein